MCIGISSAVNQLRNGTANIRDPVRGFASQASGFLSQGQLYVNIGFGYVRQYDTPRYIYIILYFIIILCLDLLLV